MSNSSLNIMEQSNSSHFQFDRETLKRWFRTSIIIFAPAITLFLSQAQTGNFDLTAIKAAAIASVIDLIRRYITDYSKQNGTER